MIKSFVEGIILIVLGIILKIYYPKFRGFMGEFWVKLELKKLPKNKYVVLNDIMIKDEKGTHQIDHLVLSKFGIFVIEMKNYYGLIKGKEYDNKWCQYLGKNKSYFVNPIHQNYGHLKSLSNLLKLDDKCFIPIVCFSNQAKIAVKSRSIVTQVDYLKSEILKYEELLVDKDIKELANIIISNNIEDKFLRKQHVKDIRIKINNNRELENNMICPKCGNKLVERNGKYGKFIGCSNYPKCKYIKK
ncbi:MAG: NERD domain-containing protein [Bacilli bacterium]|nr:NERD domain-containing protein [Bacilli bacterium]